MEILERKMTAHALKLKFPDWRHQIIQTLRELSDELHQREHWVYTRESQPDPSPFQRAIDSIINDGWYDDYPERAIGGTLRDIKEAMAMYKVAKSMLRVLDVQQERKKAAGNGSAWMTNAETIELAQWKDVVEASRSALDLMEKNDARAQATP